MYFLGKKGTLLRGDEVRQRTVIYKTSFDIWRAFYGHCRCINSSQLQFRCCCFWVFIDFIICIYFVYCTLQHYAPTRSSPKSIQTLLQIYSDSCSSEWIEQVVDISERHVLFLPINWPWQQPFFFGGRSATSIPSVFVGIGEDNPAPWRSLLRSLFCLQENVHPFIVKRIASGFLNSVRTPPGVVNHGETSGGLFIIHQEKTSPDMVAFSTLVF